MAKFTVEQLNGQYEGTLREFISNPDNWRRFLDTAARMYKYDFRTQVLIFSQRPSVCACADFDFWTRRAQRSVRRGSSGIGIVSEERGKARVSYLFDVTDTVPRKENIPPPYIWSLREEAQENTLQALSDVTGEDTHVSGTFAVDLFVAAQVAASRIASKQSSDPVFLRAAMSSAAWCVLRRCGIDPSPLVRGIPVDQFDPSQLAQLGSIVQQSANTVLRVVEQTVRQLEGRKIHQVKSKNHLAEQVSVMYNKSKESAGKLAEKGVDEHERTGESDTGERDVPHGDGRQAVPRPDAEGVRPVRRGASAGADAVRTGAIPGADRGGRAERLSERRGAAGAGGAGEDRAGDGAEGRDGRSAQGARPDEMGEADEQLPSLRGGDRPTELVVGQDTDKAAEQSAAFAFSDSEGEQLSLSLYGDAERRWDAPHRKSRAKPQTAAPAEDVFQKNTSDVFDWNTPDVTGDVIDRLLTAGGNEMHSRERIAAFFLQDRFEPEDAADFLRREYGTGGKGVRVDGVDYSLWFDKDGLRIARGHDTRTARAVTLSYADVAERIDRLLQDGHYASAAQLADARPNEYREIASDIWHVYHDRGKSADRHSFFAQTAALIKGGYPDAVARIAEGLSDPVQRAALTAELSAFTAAAQTDSSLYRFSYIRTRAAQTVERLQRAERMNKEYAAADGFEPSRPSFITQNEIDHMLCGGSHVDGGKHRIYSFLTDSHTKKERIDFIKDEYGTGGYGHAGYDEWHDSAGISLKRADEKGVYDTIKLSWSQVEQHLGALIRQGRYMTADEIEQYERSRTDTVRLTEESPAADVFRANTSETDIHGIKEYSFEYQLLDRLRTGCNYFLGAGGRSEKHLWAGSVYAQIAKMRELYELPPEKPEWLTKEAIDSYAERMAPRYLVVVYHHSENGFDEKLDYQTLAEAEKAAQGYVAGTMEMDGFAYDGAAVYDQQEHKYLRIFGKYPDQAAQSAATDLAHDVFQKNTSDASAGAVPIIRCEWSESAVFEDGKEYSVAEFDRLMKQADDEYVAGKNAAMQKYGTWQQWYDADDPYFARFLGYDKTKFTLILPDGRTFTERQDIGDGDGGVLDFLSQYDQYRDIVPLLRRVVDAERDVFHGNTLEEAAQSAAAD